MSSDKNQTSRRKKKIGSPMPGLRLPKWANEVQIETYKRLRAAVSRAEDEKAWLDTATELARYVRENFGSDAADGLWTAVWNFNMARPGARDSIVTCPNCGNWELPLMLVERIEVRHARITSVVREENKPTQAMFLSFFKDQEPKYLDAVPITKGIIWPEGCRHKELKVRCAVCDCAWEALDTVDFDPGYDGSSDAPEPKPAPKSMLN